MLFYKVKSENLSNFKPQRVAKPNRREQVDTRNRSGSPMGQPKNAPPVKTVPPPLPVDLPLESGKDEVATRMPHASRSRRFVRGMEQEPQDKTEEN